jgi:hypothetical protein
MEERGQRMRRGEKKALTNKLLFHPAVVKEKKSAAVLAGSVRVMRQVAWGSIEAHSACFWSGQRETGGSQICVLVLSVMLDVL